MASESKMAILAAIVGNLVVAVTKFIAALLTGSSAMLSEGIHSLVDTGNEGFLLLGIHRSRKPPDDAHPFGHGHELYFWTLIVAIMIFAVGGGISVYEGVTHILHPKSLEDPFWNYVVLGIAVVCEGISWVFGWKAFSAAMGEGSILQTIHRSKDPTTFVVLFEDSAALLGLMVAFGGIYLGHQFQNPYFDPASSIVIGIILGAVSILLAYESKGLLIGEGVSARMTDSIRRMVEADPAIERAKRPLTMYFGPHDVLLAVDVQFARGLSAAEVAEAVERLEKQIRVEHPDIKQIFIEARSLVEHRIEEEETDER